MQRVLAIIMCAIMVISLFGTLIYYLTLPTFAADAKLDPASGDPLIRVGLMYGDNVTIGFETDAPYGFFVHSVNRSGDLTHTPIFELDIAKVSCIVDGNLSKSAMTYAKTADPAQTVVGGYHAELAANLTYDALIAVMADSSAYATLGISPIPAYINGSYRLRAGQFADSASASAAASLLTQLTGMQWQIASPTASAVALIDPYTDKLLFEYDDGGVTALGLTARPAPDGEKAYLVTPAQKQYDGVFMFNRNLPDYADGVALTDIIPLEEYIKGVLPYEISNSWPIEAQKAFAICVRSFTMSYINRHEKAYGFDICNNTHCQVYHGRRLINDAVEQAVAETEGLVMVSEGKIVRGYYSSSTGGVTVSSKDAWGGSFPYLVAVETPWERYQDYYNGEWQTEVSPKDLLTYLRDTKGYTELRGEIKDVHIDQLAENSTYVYQLTVTDSYGTKVTFKASDNVRMGLSRYLPSANFVVGKGKVTAVISTRIESDAADLRVIDASGERKLAADKVTVLSAYELGDTAVDSAYVMTAGGEKRLTGSEVVTETTTVYAENPNNFIFVGKGYGHGVGLSQWGVYDLANLGVPAEEILPKYFTGIAIKDWRLVQ